MKNVFTTISALLVALAFSVSCNTTSALLPNISGKAGEVVVVMDKNEWEGVLGETVRELLEQDCPYLASREPMYSLVNVSVGGFMDMFKIHRNILIFNINPAVEKEGLIYQDNAWAQPQRIIQVNARDSDSAMALVLENDARIMEAFEQAERDRIIQNSKQYEEGALAEAVKERFGGSPHFPVGYKFKKVTDDFVWIADVRQYTQQHILIYRFPADEKENFTQENLVARRNAILQTEVPGQREDSWMTTSEYIETSLEFKRFRGLQFAELRGYWEVYNDYMGGPFVLHAFYSQDASEIIVLDAFVYAPRYDKRQYLRVVESIIYSFEWEKSADEEEDSTPSDESDEAA